ncbi:hypothetical protein AMK28_34215 [Streptomyces sp. CB02115]|nr:hypothetical protein AMK28_34215 [Streptomyces sp. CB02115]
MRRRMWRRDMSRFIWISGRSAGAGAGFAVTHLSAVVDGVTVPVSLGCQRSDRVHLPVSCPEDSDE